MDRPELERRSWLGDYFDFSNTQYSNSKNKIFYALIFSAVASQLDCNFLKVVSSAIVDKYIGESARMIREMFNYARDHQPCIVFMDEIDAIGLFVFLKGLLQNSKLSFLLFNNVC